MILNLKLLIIISASIFYGCVHSPKCGNLEGARIVYTGTNSCLVRIREVTIATNLKIPESMKDSDLVRLELGWVEPIMKDGQIVLGHFILSPKSIKATP
jgi:hypothetical protein